MFKDNVATIKELTGMHYWGVLEYLELISAGNTLTRKEAEEFIQKFKKD